MSRMYRGKGIFKPLNTGWIDDLDFAFAHRDKLCSLFARWVPDPEAPFDGYDEREDTEEKARSLLLSKKGRKDLFCFLGSN